MLDLELRLEHRTGDCPSMKFDDVTYRTLVKINGFYLAGALKDPCLNFGYINAKS